MTEETRLKAPVLARLSSDKVFCYLSMALFLALPIVEIITEVLGKNKIKVIGPRPPYPAATQKKRLIRQLYPIQGNCKTQLHKSILISHRSTD